MSCERPFNVEDKVAQVDLDSPVCFPALPDGGRHVGVPVHEAIHGGGNVPAPSGLLPAPPQQLLRLLRPVPPPGRLGGAWPQPLLHLLRGLPADELLQLSRPPQMSRVRTNVLLTLLRRQTHIAAPRQHRWGVWGFILFFSAHALAFSCQII